MTEKLFKNLAQFFLKSIGDFAGSKNLLTQSQMGAPTMDDLQYRIIPFFSKDHPHCIAADFNDCQMGHSEVKRGSAKIVCGMYERSFSGKLFISVGTARVNPDKTLL